ncbi:dihydropteroate synthase [candidate division WOR-1 bacterium RIFOXYB2_FULL_42_35]|uniref:Dihydropteroate synthase n=1 Tax=candidate division WOR-1 bacterium RIFOXYC2_FULL_41_25 TaxID=1802586 RepID=A0A1F4TPS2_UNCSA|nr:MAG: dihydropteroate synthase [candidate division WOR-1 bacterium RIFOXYB2_FULL_42_35]OGC24581.1 MAG: dihydropteroate synthase [candidate division WOR-1 bacterium RIFOXYA2_FULL_41_14]OGC34627.1 MAG: dihydropteroate synthase [candidate division WOR-1 bacterium RIFOXYC2_FULL_41_25]OGC42092.1 MAG: dihydropteroate synthase [candidate division WOR-1 bacterium RIFOXYD2_FULL_41_8]
MIPRIIELANVLEAKKELLGISVDPKGVELMTPKAIRRVLKLKNLRPVAANIIKQEMLSFGGEAATAYGSINQSVETTDVLVFGTLRQLQMLIVKLQQHQFGLPALADEISQTLANYGSPPKLLQIGQQVWDFKQKTYIMGVLNITPDSFSDGGKFLRIDEAVKQAKAMLAAGADIIDVGGESTRPGSDPVPIEEEKRRVLPVIEKLVKETGCLVSIDTTKAEVASAALSAGAAMVNDISGLHSDPAMAEVVAKYKVPICLMHIFGQPKTMQENPSYKDLLGDIVEYLSAGLEIAKKAGILHEKIVVDPGIGFGKTVQHNLEIIKRLRELKSLGCPILIGTSRKSLIGKVLDLPVEQRLEGSAVTAALAIANGANIIRVHDVKEMVLVAKMTDAIVKT